MVIVHIIFLLADTKPNTRLQYTSGVYVTWSTVENTIKYHP